MLTLEHILLAKKNLEEQFIDDSPRTLYGSGKELKVLNPNLDIEDDGVYILDSDGNIERLG